MYILPRTILLAALAAVISSAGCRHRGPAERAGEEIDDAVGDAADSIGDRIEDETDRRHRRRY